MFLRNPFAQKDPSCLPELPTVRALGTITSDPMLHRNARPAAGPKKRGKNRSTHRGEIVNSPCKNDCNLNEVNYFFTR